MIRRYFHLFSLLLLFIISACSSDDQIVESVSIPMEYIEIKNMEAGKKIVVIDKRFVISRGDSIIIYNEEGEQIAIPNDPRKISLTKESDARIWKSYVLVADDKAIIYPQPYETMLSDESNKTAREIEAEGRSFNWARWSMVLSIIIMTVLLGVLLYFIGFVLWARAKISGVRIGLYELVIMRWKGVSRQKIIHEMIKAREAGIDIPQSKLVSHELANGNIVKVVDSIIAAKNADIHIEGVKKLDLDFDTAANIDLAGLDVQRAVKNAIDFQVIETDRIKAVPKDGVEMTMRCKVTLRPILARIVSGAKEDTVLARISEAVSTQIGETESHYEVLKSPYKIADEVEKKTDLIADTAYQLISVDISDVDVGKDLHAELAIERAEAREKAAHASVAVAKSKEQEMIAKEQEARVRLVEAEIEVQKAMAVAFLDGKLSIHEYHEMKNTEADTEMREAFGHSVHNKKKKH